MMRRSLRLFNSTTSKIHFQKYFKKSLKKPTGKCVSKLLIHTELYLWGLFLFFLEVVDIIYFSVVLTEVDRVMLWIQMDRNVE